MTLAISTRTPVSTRRCVRRAIAKRCGRGLVDGTINAVCSDHTPVDDDAKLMPLRRTPKRAPPVSSCCWPLTLK